MRILRMLGAVLVGLVVIVGVALFGFVRGWHVDEVTPGELSAMLRPHDEILTPEGKGPFPTVLLFPGCSGPLRDYTTYARDFRHLGFASVIVDSNGHRGLDRTARCQLATTPWPAERAGDVLVSLYDARSPPVPEARLLIPNLRKIA
jgi:hypothetical protein